MEGEIEREGPDCWVCLCCYMELGLYHDNNGESLKALILKKIFFGGEDEP